jgi:lauroyl/myristoyl acyltransferase
VIFGEGKAKDLYRRLVWGPGVTGVGLLPVGVEHRVFRGLGRVASVAAPRKRREVEENLARAFPSGRVPDGRLLSVIASDAFAAHFANQYIGASFVRCTGEDWPVYLAWRGLSRLQTHIRDGLGVVLAHPHMGPAQLPTHVLGRLGLDVVQVGGGRITRVALSETGEWARQRRADLESEMSVPVHDGAQYLRPLLRRLGNGAVVMTAADGTGGGSELGRRLVRTVLDQPMGIPVGPVWLALKSGAPLLTLHCYRNPGDGPLYIAEVGDEIQLDRDQPTAGVLEDGADHLAAWLDRVLRAHPGDWLLWDGFAKGALLP